MHIYLTAQNIITVGAVITAVTGIITLAVRLFKWFERQKRQDAEIADMKEELCLLTYGILACLKGLSEQGCNGPVTEAIRKVEKHVNEKAHDQKNFREKLK